MTPVELHSADALVAIDIQNDFVTGSLAVPDAATIVPVMNSYVAHFRRRGLSVVATRDWHPPDHMSFRARGGKWPPHCVAGTQGAAFVPDLVLPPEVLVVSKAMTPDCDAYSGFEGTALDALLRGRGVQRLFIGGLATDYCVLATVRDALRLGYAVFLLADAIRAVDARPGDGAAAEREMTLAGAVTIRLEELASGVGIDG